MNAHMICPVIALALAMEELDRLKALGAMPTPEDLQQALQNRLVDFDMLVGAAGVYLRERGLVEGCHE